MLAAWSYVAATIETSDNFLSTVLVSGRDASLPGIETLMGPTSTTVPLDVSFQSPSTTTFRDLASNVQNRLLDVSVIQHVYEFDTQLQDMVESAPLVGVYPAEEYEESPTEHLRNASYESDAFCGCRRCLFLSSLLFGRRIPGSMYRYCLTSCGLMRGRRRGIWGESRVCWCVRC